MGQKGSNLLNGRVGEDRSQRHERRRSLHFPLKSPSSQEAKRAVGGTSGSEEKGKGKGRPKSLAPLPKPKPEEDVGKSDTLKGSGANLLKEGAVNVIPEAPARACLRIAIVGGGIGGLSLATFLSSLSSSSGHKKGFEIDIYESSPSLTELGAGVGMWLRTWRIMTSFKFCEGQESLVDGLKGIAPEGRDMGEVTRKAFEFRRGDGGKEGKSFYTMMVPFGVLTLHRADFQQVLARRAIPFARPHFGKRLVNYTEDASGEITLYFADSTTAICDVLVGADGIRSITRGVMYRRLAERGELDLPMMKVSEGPSIHIDDTKARHPAEDEVGFMLTDVAEHSSDDGAKASNDSCRASASQGGPKSEIDPVIDLIEPVWSGTYVYRYLIPKAKLEERWPDHRAGRGPVVYFGKNKHIIAYPVAQSSTPMVNLVAFTSDPSQEGTRIEGAWVRPAPNANLVEEFDGWEDEVKGLLELAENPLLWAIHTVKSLPHYSDGRVVLLGDAAHAMTPHQGAGGGQAIEDAHVLSALLAHPLVSRSTLSLALQAYDAIRIPISRGVVHSSRLNGMMYEFNHAWADTRDADDPDSGGTSERGEDAEGTAGSGSTDLERRRLEDLAGAIMEIHKWEWEDEPQESQPQHAVRVFEELLKGGHNV